MAGKPWSLTADGVVLTIRLTPKGGRDAIDGVDVLADGRPVLVVRVRAAPANGEANLALIRLVAKAVGVPPRDVAIVAGATARLKRLLISGDAPTLIAALEKLRRRAKACPVELGWRTWARVSSTAKTIAADLRGKVSDAVHRLRRDRGVVPGIAVVLVGNNPASEVYVRNKSKAVAESGMRAFDCKLAAIDQRSGTARRYRRAQCRRGVSGILVQLPLPKQIDAQKIIAAIDPAKDVDGFHPINVGRLASGLPALVPCTPMGCVILAKKSMKRRGPRSRGDRPLEYRRQTGGAACCSQKTAQ